MINRDEMMSDIITACPEFAPIYESFVADWRDEAETPLYHALGDFARYLISLLNTRDHWQIDAAFETIERLLIDGDDSVREAATIGILESLQNTHLHADTKPEQFLEFLRPVSLRYWKKVEDFWDSGRIITDD